MRGTTGLVLLDKPTGVTSFQALNLLKQRLGTGRVGHAGTLDRFASGLLVVLCGGMTRFASIISEGEKTYEARIRFGAETDTLDPEGAVIAEAQVPEWESIERALPAFLGRIAQRPPAYSAVHVGGKRAYQIARSGKEPAVSERIVTIGSIDVTSFAPPDLSVRLQCSKGTYVRSFARDLALACGSRGHVVALRRTQIGGFSLSDSVEPMSFTPGRDLWSWSKCLEKVKGVEQAVVGSEAARSIRVGRRLPPGTISEGNEGLIALFNEEDQFLALVRRIGVDLNYVFVSSDIEDAAPR